MKILVLCDQGNNRSVTLAHQLKYLDHDVLSAGINVLTDPTLTMLTSWADKIIATDQTQVNQMLNNYPELADTAEFDFELWDLGPDVYPRPFNKELLRKCRALVELHRGEL